MKCPSCGELLASNMWVCGKCGKPLPTAPLESRPAVISPEQKPAAPLQFLRPSEVALTIPLVGETLFAQINKYLLVGRRTPDVAYTMIDLAPYTDYPQGISRRHAALYFKEGTLRIRDVQSRNGTWVNGTRLPQGTAKALTSGDQITIGDIDFFVFF